MWIGTCTCKQLSVNNSLFGVCSVCVPFVSCRVDRDPAQTAQMGNTQSSLYASDLLPWGHQAVMVLWVVCSLFGKLQKLLNERGADLPLYRTRLRLHNCFRHSNNTEKGNCTHQEITTKKLQSQKKIKKTFNTSHVTLLLGVQSQGQQHINLHWHACMSSRSVDPRDTILQSTSSEQCVCVCEKKSTFHWNAQG